VKTNVNIIDEMKISNAYNAAKMNLILL